MSKGNSFFGMGIAGYRSIRDPQFLGPLGRINIIAGMNNSGKSNFLRFAQGYLRSTFAPFSWDDNPIPAGPDKSLFVAYPAPGSNSLATMSRGGDISTLEYMFSDPIFHPVEGGEVWLKYSLSDNATSYESQRWTLDGEFVQAASRIELPRDGSQISWSSASSWMNGISGGHEGDDVRRVLDKVFPLNFPPVYTIDAFRQIRVDPGSSDVEIASSLNGVNLVERLASLERPVSQNYARDRPKFDAINDFARSVLDDSSVELKISADRTELQVSQGARVLPLINLGTGVHQVVIIAAASTLVSDSLICMEEPELHLHPILQKKLIKFLNEKTSNQYLIATHSAQFLDHPGARVFHVTHDEFKGTVCRSASSGSEVAAICHDLGYRPSDLIQANAVIWVEGPSDRIYIRKWIEMLAPGEFIEGVHYSVMFYGGGLVKHLTGHDSSEGGGRDDGAEDFISLRRLNRWSSIVIDSDKKSAQSRVNSTKKRIVEEFNDLSSTGLAWVTGCRTIENYVPQHVLAAAATKVHPRGTYCPPKTKWDSPLVINSGGGGRATPIAPNKVLIAREVVSRWPLDTFPYDLRENVLRLIGFIRRANIENV
ncbi:AAA family ATPase [Micrococcaceae bacterium Sec6.3]